MYFLPPEPTIYYDYSLSGDAHAVLNDTHTHCRQSIAAGPCRGTYAGGWRSSAKRNLSEAAHGQSRQATLWLRTAVVCAEYRYPVIEIGWGMGEEGDMGMEGRESTCWPEP